MPIVKGPMKRPAVRKPTNQNSIFSSRKIDNSVHTNKNLRQTHGDLAKSLIQSTKPQQKKKTVTEEQQRKRAILIARQKQILKQRKKINRLKRA